MAAKIIIFLIWVIFGLLNVVEINNVAKKNRLEAKDVLFYAIGYFVCGFAGFLIIVITNKIVMKKWWI